VRAHAPLRRALARLATRWMALRGWERLGYARLSDHARERLGLAARQVQELARVDAALAALPRIDAAFSTGALPWTRARLLCSVATPADEDAWLAFARRTTARALAREVRAVDAGALEAGALGLEDRLDSYPFVTVQVRCSGATHGKWWRVRQLAPRIAGERLTAWACMESVVGEVLSTLPLADVPNVFENEFVNMETLVSTRGCGRAERDEPRAANGCASHGFADPLDPVPAPLPPPPVIAALVDDLDSAEAFGLEDRLRRALALEQRRWAELAPLLAEVMAGRLYLAHGHRSFASWVQERLGISPRKARALLRLERAAAVCPAFGSAWREGRLSWVQAQMLVAIVVLDESLPWRAAWIAHAERVSVRRLEEDVERAVALRELEPPAERQTGAPPTEPEQSLGDLFELPQPRRFFFTAPRDVARLIRATICSVRRHLEQRTGRPCSEDEAVGAMLDHALTAWCAGQPRAHVAHRVFARDGWRCTVPGCTSYRNLHDHHVVFRSAGGSDELVNRLTLCAFHHLRGVHAGRVSVTGRAPSRLRFALGLRPDRAPLLRYRSGDWREVT